jgi:branched-chain amino acid transport system permease protein
MIGLLATQPLVAGELADLLSSPSELSRVLIEGLAKASLYLMIASGLTLIFGLMDVINFAHGAFTMYGAYIAGVVILALGVGSLGPGSAVLVFLLVMAAVFVALAVTGTVFELTLIRRLYEYPPIFMILLTFGVAITLEELMRMVVEFQNVNNGQWNIGWATPRQDTVPETLVGRTTLGPFGLDLHPLEAVFGVVVLATVAAVVYVALDELAGQTGVGAGAVGIPTPAGTDATRLARVVVAVGAGAVGAAGAVSLLDPLSGTTALGAITFRGLDPLEISLGLVTLVGIWAFLNKTRYGLFVRAGVEDDEMAKALGIDIKRTFTVVFAIGSGLAGAAGVMLMWDPLWRVEVPLALDVLLPAFVIVIVGGLGSFKGTVVASLLVGMLDAAASWAFQVGVVEFTDVDQLLIFAILVVMLILRPRGLFGVKGQGDHG